MLTKVIGIPSSTRMVDRKEIKIRQNIHNVKGEII